MGDRTDLPAPGTPDLNRNRLPTLGEVLNRNTLAPVDLFSFYIYMRDIQRSVDYLDFWYEGTFIQSMMPRHLLMLALGSMSLNTLLYAVTSFEDCDARCSSIRPTWRKLDRSARHIYSTTLVI